MKALFLDGNETLRIEDVPKPSPKSGEVLVQVLHSAVCQTEYRFYFGDGADRILGHEFVGRVVETGSDVSNLSPGDPVMCYPSLPCGTCEICQAGKSSVCTHKIGLRGGFAEYIAADAGYFLKIPEDFATRYGTLLYDVFGLTYRGLEPLGLSANSITAVVGLLSYGLGAVAIARHYGARVIAIDASPYRLNIAKDLGAEIILNANQQDLKAQIKHMTNDENFTEVIECTAPEIPFEDLFSWTRNGGRLCILGHTNKPFMMNPNWVTTREITVSGTPRFVPDQLPDILDVTRACKNKGSIITHEPPLELSPAKEAFEDYAAGNAGKVTFDLT